MLCVCMSKAGICVSSKIVLHFFAGKRNEEKITRKKRRKQYRKKKKQLWQQLALEALQKRCRETVEKYNAMLAADIEEKKKRDEEKKLKIYVIRPAPGGQAVFRCGWTEL